MHGGNHLLAGDPLSDPADDHDRADAEVRRGMIDR